MHRVNSFLKLGGEGGAESSIWARRRSTAAASIQKKSGGAITPLLLTQERKDVDLKADMNTKSLEGTLFDS